MTNLLETARTIVHDCLVQEFLNAHRERPIDPVELLCDVESYCRTFGVSTPQR